MSKSKEKYGYVIKQGHLLTLGVTVIPPRMLKDCLPDIGFSDGVLLAAGVVKTKTFGWGSPVLYLDQTEIGTYAPRVYGNNRIEIPNCVYNIAIDNLISTHVDVKNPEIFREWLKLAGKV